MSDSAKFEANLDCILKADALFSSTHYPWRFFLPNISEKIIIIIIIIKY